MKALVTGATGFIGSHLAQALLDRDFTVSCLIRKNSKLKNIKGLNLTLLEADYQNPQSLPEAVKNQDYIFHVAGIINARKWDTYYNANCKATENLIRAAWENNPKIKKFVFVSSISAAGPSKKGIFKQEDAENTPNSNYGKSKLIAEEKVLEYKDKLPVLIIRPPNVIGPRQKELFEAIKLVKKRIFPKIGNGDKQTSLIYVKDLVNGCINAALNINSTGKTYFLNYKDPYSWKEITLKIAEQLNKKGFKIIIPYSLQYIIAMISETISSIFKKPPLVSRENLKMARDCYWLYNCEKIEKELGITAKTDLNSSIKNTLDWYKEHKYI